MNQACRFSRAMKSNDRHLSRFRRGAGGFNIKITDSRSTGFVQSPVFSAWKTRTKHMKIPFLHQRLHVSKLFIVPDLAVFGEPCYGRSIQETSPIEHALLPPAAFCDWS